MLAPGASPFVLLTGPNGAGKTNVLEAVSLLSVGRGLRGAPLSQMAERSGPGGFQLKADLVPDPELPAVEIHSFSRPEAPDRRLLKVNGAPASLSTLSEWVSILWLTPAMDRLFAEAPSERRRFLDRLTLALSPDHARHSTRYEAAMRARTRLLTDERGPDPLWLNALEAEMAEHGEAITAARKDAVALLEERLASLPPGPFPRPSLALSGDEAQGELLAQLRSMRAADANAGRALKGPHRADLLVTHAEKEMPAALASTGEQKALLVAIILAHAALVAERSGRAPLLLLDEAAAHLDRARRDALYERLAGLGGQAWLSGTDPALFDGLAAARYEVANGRAEPC